MSKLALKLPKEYWSEEQIEKRLIEDCKEAIVKGRKERNYSLKREKYKIGSRILEDEDYLNKKYGDHYYETLAEKINEEGYGVDQLRKCVQFAGHLKALEWLDDDSISWEKIRTELMVSKEKQLEPIEFNIPDIMDFAVKTASEEEPITKPFNASSIPKVETVETVETPPILIKDLTPEQKAEMGIINEEGKGLELWMCYQKDSLKYCLDHSLSWSKEKCVKCPDKPKCSTDAKALILYLNYLFDLREGRTGYNYLTL